MSERSAVANFKADGQFTPMDGTRAAALIWAMTSMDLNALASGAVGNLPAPIQPTDIN